MEFKYPVILDGATGTELLKRGFDGKGCSEKWIADHPDIMLSLQREYIDAGSDIIYTPTFGANRAKLEKYGLENELSDLNKRLVEISVQAADGKALVAGDIAPTGLFLRKGTERLFDIYLEQAQVLLDSGVDLFVIETMMTMADTVNAVKAVRSVCSLPVLVSCSCDASMRMLDGTPADEAALRVKELGADAFGLNCSAGPDGMLKNIEKLKGVTDLPLIAKPNAGLPRVQDGMTVYDCTPDEFASYATGFAKCGVKFIGGCCGTGPEHIRKISGVINDVRR